MIVANRKPFEEIVELIKPYKKIVLLGCNECVTVCAVGGAKEVEVLASELRMYREKEGQPIEIKEHVPERNCDPEYVEPLGAIIADAEAVLSMACGCGIQFVGEHYIEKSVLPAVNTTFDGVTMEHGVWSERCLGCGNCILDKTLGVCPVTRCAKSIFNGPCGGSHDGKCEVNAETPCAWQLIVDRYKERNMLDKYLEIQPVKNWSTAHHGGPRTRVREDLKL
ncbi:MAG TPA: methylenetetrahydrofolate reductase C-terminal domain-containing protein [Spirochaetia bacterium]|nr:methylenetetrahydrofolate reductase C-terminal domain-containing protein [Spirochaetia bacterium]